ncbi:MAG TPA: GFA family protein [Steroidobacteraceae bacterium]|nr:GFA family protein [Steroidobacteraceae bacterium]
MTPTAVYPLEGGCDCGLIRYRMESAPLIVHCCHCRWCQRETGTAFALNALIEAERVVHLKSEPEIIATPSQSGRGQKIARCPSCRLAVWSYYAGAGPIIRFIRVGTLDTPEVLRPDIHIFTASRQPWVVLPEGVRAVPEFYEIERCWSPESLARREVFLPRLRAYRAAQSG